MISEYPRKDLKKAIQISQHTQRNWDLSRSIPQEDLDILTEAVTQCPSKQNFAFYKAHFITNRDVIKKLHNASWGLGYYDAESHSRVETTNSQVLANLLIVFEEIEPSIGLVNKMHDRDNAEAEILKRDRQMAVGIAAGYVNMTAAMMGYGTGCCACYDSKEVQEILNLKGKACLLMGVGYKDLERSRREHHITGVKIPRRPKENIQVEHIA